MMTEITLCDALSLANGAKKAMAEGYESRYMPYMAMAAAKLADDLAVWQSRAEAAESALQNLMSFLSVNGCWTDIDSASAELRIRDGIGMLVKPALIRAEAAEAELRKAREQEPVAWMHDKEGRVDVCHDSVKKLWIKVGQKQNTQFMREIVPCKVEHYNIPLYAAPKPAAYGVDDATAQHIALAVYDYQNRISDEPLMHAINRILIKESHLLSAEYLAQMQAPKPVAPAVPNATCNDDLQVPLEWSEVMTGLVAIAEKKGKRQGSPNHCHAIPGIWDDDNGVLAGKPCDVCAMYDRARALLQSAEPNNNAAADRLLDGMEN